MNYSKINFYDIANGPGVRISIFVSGCNNHCKGCFNEETWDFNAGFPFGKNEMNNILEHLRHYYIDGITILGGEPLDRKNQEGVYNILRQVKKSKWLYTGYTIRKIPETKWTSKILRNLDYIVDGPFIESLKDITLPYRGSSNQRIINVKEDPECRLFI